MANSGTSPQACEFVWARWLRYNGGDGRDHHDPASGLILGPSSYVQELEGYTMCMDHDDHHCRCVVAPMEKFVQPCLLLLLRGQSTHGYELIRSLGETCEIAVGIW